MEPPVSFDRVAHAYDASRALPPALQRFAIETLARRIGLATLLEAGVGTGRFAVPLQEAGVRVTGCDVAPKMLARAREKGLRSVLFADIRALPFRDQAFDWGMTSHLLHLVLDWRVGLGEVTRVVKDRYVSVLERSTGGPDLQREYHRFAELEGAPAESWGGLPERRLARRLRPDRVYPSPRVDWSESTDRYIDRLAGRTMSSQWRVPQRAHLAAIRRLRREFGGGEIREKWHVEVAEWEIGRIRHYVARARPTAPKRISASGPRRRSL